MADNFWTLVGLFFLLQLYAVAQLNLYLSYYLLTWSQVAIQFLICLMSYKSDVLLNQQRRLNIFWPYSSNIKHYLMNSFFNLNAELSIKVKIIRKYLIGEWNIFSKALTIGCGSAMFVLTSWLMPSWFLRYIISMLLCCSIKSASSLATIPLISLTFSFLFLWILQLSKHGNLISSWIYFYFTLITFRNWSK